MVRLLFLGFTLFLVGVPTVNAQDGVPSYWKWEWPETAFENASVDFKEIISGGPSKDGIPSIDTPIFQSIALQSSVLAPTEPVISIEIGGDARAYPLRILMWHEIVNDVIGETPLAVTYCPLCNAAIVFESRVKGQRTTFGTTGKLRNSDLVMYDRLTESWWQQFSGKAIVGEQTGTELKVLASRLESFERFTQRFPHGKVLVPNEASRRAYGKNPYLNYDSSQFPFLFRGPLPDGIPALARVIAVNETAWSLTLLKSKGSIRHGDLEISWSPGQNSALDAEDIGQGKHVGNVVVQRIEDHGKRVDVPYDVTFAFVFKAFRPEGTLVQ